MLRELFLQVLNEYRDEMQRPFAGNALASVLRKDLPESIKSLGSITDVYKVDGSPGKGNWAEVPWVGVFDRQITETAEKGYYIVYLFDADMNGVYLSLNQGWDQYEVKFGTKNARHVIKQAAKNLQQQLKSTLRDFDFLPINLHPKNKLGKGYELGHICGKFYARDYIPQDEFLINDLRNLVGVYRELRGMVGTSILDLQDYNLAEADIGQQTTHEPKEITLTELVLQNIEAGEKKIKTNDKKAIIHFDEDRQKRHKKIGDTAELLVVDIERRNLQKIGREDLSQRVSLVADNISLGYDVLSFEPDGTEKYIEVKGSESNDSHWFYLTRNEIEKSQQLKNYYLYHVHGIETKTPSIQFVRHPIFHGELFLLEPQQYLVKYLSK